MDKAAIYDKESIIGYCSHLTRHHIIDIDWVEFIGKELILDNKLEFLKRKAKPDVARIIEIFKKIGEIRTDELREELKIEI